MPSVVDTKIDGKRCMVTGGCGLIGSYIVDQCLEKGCTVVIVDSLVVAVPTKENELREVPVWTKAQQEKYGAKVDLRIGKMQDREFMRKALQGVEYVFHLAAQGGFQRPFSPYFDSNITGTSVMFDIIWEENKDGKQNAPVKKIVAASSMAMYGEGSYKRKNDGKVIHAKQYRKKEQFEKQQWEYRCPETDEVCEPFPITEDHPGNGTSAYAMSKQLKEKMCFAFGQELGIDICMLRYSLTYGPRQSLHNPYTGMISIFSSLIMNDKAPTVYEDGNQMRDFVFVSDNAAANIACMESANANGKCFNISTGKGTSVATLATFLIKAFGKERTLKTAFPGSFRVQDCRDMVLDSSALKKATGWAPTTTFEQGVQKQVDWVLEEKKKGEVIKDYFTEATAKSGLVHTAESDAKKRKMA